MYTKDDSVFAQEEPVVVSFEVTEDKPFNKCFECKSFRNGCSGPNLSVMPIGRVCEFLQSVRVFLKYSYQDTADGSGISLATVKRTLCGKVSDPSFFTISAISTFLLGDPNGKYPCAIPNVTSDSANETKLNDALTKLERAISDNERTTADNEEYRKALADIHTSYNAEMQLIRDEAKQQFDFARQQIDFLSEEVKYWRAENERKGKLIDRYMEKIVSK